MVRNQKGFSFVELIVTMALLAIVSLAIGGFITTGSRSFVNSNREIEVQKEAQLSMNQMVDLIIDVEKGVQLEESTASLTGSEGAANVTKRELKLYNQKNNKSYMLRWYGSSDSITSDKENCIYLVEGTNEGEGEVVDIQFTGEEYLLAQYVADFEADISELSERKVGLRMVYTVDNRTYETRETVKMRNDVATSTELAKIYDGEPVKIVWIESVNLAGANKITVGQTKTYAATLVGEADAVNLGVVWSVKRVDGTALSAGTAITGTDKFTGSLTVAATEALGTLEVKCASVSDSSKYAVMYVEVVDAEPTIAPTPSPSPTPTPTSTPEPTKTPEPQLKAPEAEIYVSDWGYTNESGRYPHYASLKLIPKAEGNQAHIVKTEWEVDSGWARYQITNSSDYDFGIRYGRDFWGDFYVQATVMWSDGTISTTEKVELQTKGIWDNSEKKVVFVDRNEVKKISQEGDSKCAWQLIDQSGQFLLNNADKGGTYIPLATEAKVKGSEYAALDKQYECELLRKESNQHYEKTLETYILIIPKAQLILSDYHLTCSKNSSTEQIDIDIHGVEDSLETYKVEIVNGTSKGTVIKEFENKKDDRFKIFIGKDETVAVVYVKVTATCQNTDFTALVAVEVGN